MTKVTHYNTLGTKECRIVASYDVDTNGDTSLALQLATYRACVWNKDETRENMRVNFVMANGHVRAI